MTSSLVATSPEIVARAHRHRDRLALIAPEGRFTYGHLLDASARVAAALLSGRADLDGSRVAFLVPPGFRWTALQWGIWRAGGIAVPLALQHPERELAYVVQDADAEWVVTEASVGAPARAAAASLRRPVLDADEVLAGGTPAGAALPAVPPDRGALILYTSGTTGRPKGVLTTHANLVAQIRSLVEAWDWHSDDHILLVLPLHHVHGILNVVCCALWSGARCSVAPRFEATDTWERLAGGELTLFMAVPTIYRRLVETWDAADPSTRKRWSQGARELRLMVSGSAALPVQILERWQQITGHRLLERYGMTEIGMGLSNPLHGERRPGRVGTPLPGAQVRLVDEAGLPLSEGPGEIQVKGPTVFREYWRRPEDTRAVFTPDGWFRTGDVAVRDESDGSYRILGRSSVDIVKTGGEKVSALEVEEVLREHPGVADCAVVGVSDADWGERLSAAVVPSAGADPLTLDELRAWARERLAPWKIPRSLQHTAELPRNAMGKVDKGAVRRLFED
jgi:malonyl-CoA/methylmalonyl-CoA synthetase